MAISDALRPFISSAYPQLPQGENTYFTRQFAALQETSKSVAQVIRALDTTATPLGNYASDALAAAGGVALHGLYHTNGTVKVRLV